MTVRANQTNGRARNWESEVEFSPFRALSRRQMSSCSVSKSAYISNTRGSVLPDIKILRYLINKRNSYSFYVLKPKSYKPESEFCI